MRLAICLCLVVCMASNVEAGVRRVIVVNQSVAVKSADATSDPVVVMSKERTRHHHRHGKTRHHTRSTVVTTTSQAGCQCGCGSPNCTCGK